MAVRDDLAIPASVYRQLVGRIKRIGLTQAASSARRWRPSGWPKRPGTRRAAGHLPFETVLRLCRSGRHRHPEQDCETYDAVSGSLLHNRAPWFLSHVKRPTIRSRIARVACRGNLRPNCPPIPQPASLVLSLLPTNVCLDLSVIASRACNVAAKVPLPGRGQPLQQPARACGMGGSGQPSLSRNALDASA